MGFISKSAAASLTKLARRLVGDPINNKEPIVCEACNRSRVDFLPDEMPINKVFRVHCLSCRKPTEFIVRDYSTSYMFTQNAHYQIYQFMADGKKKCIRVHKGQGLSPAGRYFG